MSNKPEVLAACPPFALPLLEKALGSYVNLVPVLSLDAAQKMLASKSHIALILCGVHFDEWRMYDLLRYVRNGYPHVPFVCVRLLDTEIPRVSREALRIAAESLGAVGFVDMPELTRERGLEEAEKELMNTVLSRLRRL
jgi:hypothetical protein